MATEVFIGGSGDRAKKRNPWGVLGLGLITIGIYLIFWWYFINREMRDLGRARGISGLGDNPGLSTAAYVLSGFTLYISLVWTVVTTTQRVRRAESAASVRDPLNGWIAALVWIFTLGLGGPVLLQHHLNKVWQSEPEVPPALPGDSPTGDADLERLRKLTELKESGAISEEEFAKEKARVLPTAQPEGPEAEQASSE